MYYEPNSYDILPYRHNFSQNGEQVLTAYFIPAISIVKEAGYMDHRGYTNPEKGKEYYDKQRLTKISNPQLLVKYAAEYCYNAEEAFALEGDNKFNKVNIAEQLTAIRALKQCPPIEEGLFRFQFKGTERKITKQNVADVVWKKVAQGKVRILEHPLWLVDREELPQQEKVPITNNLYVAGVDGIDIGAAQTSDTTRDASDFCMVIKRRTFGLREPQYVAIYKDRPNDLREAYETAIALAMYYNCLINIEATRMSFVTWARDRGLLGYFMKRPSATYPDMSRRKSTQYGSPATTAVIDHQTDLIADFVNDYGHTIWFEDMLDELNRYTDENKRKFDIIAAFGECELADEELSGIVPRTVKSQEDTFEDFGYYYDERGYKKFGPIPKKVTFETNFKPYAESRYGELRTSDPRYYM